MDLARNLRIDSVTRLQPAVPLTVDAAAPVADAVALMRRENVGCLIVTAAGRPAGILTERDLLARVYFPGVSLDTPVSAVMTKDPATVRHNDPINQAIRLMVQGGYRHLPVANEAGDVVGVTSVKRIVNDLVEHFPATVYNQPPNPAQVPLEPDGG